MDIGQNNPKVKGELQGSLDHYMNDLKHSLTVSVIANIDNLMAPLHAQQLTLSQQLQATCVKLQNIESERTKTREDVAQLHRLMSQIRGESACSLSTPNDTSLGPQLTISPEILSASSRTLCFFPASSLQIS